MPPPVRKEDPGTQRQVDRLINFSDAVVAVAITLLALPLVDIAGPEGSETVWSVLGDNAGQITAFLFTFFVVTMMWLAHNRVLRNLAAIDGMIFWLNTGWLAAIVLLPWVTDMYGDTDMWGSEASAAQSDVGMVYWSLLAWLAFAGGAIGWHLDKRSDLRFDETRPYPPHSLIRWRGLAFMALFLFIGVVSMFSAEAGRWLPLLIIPLSIFMRDRGRKGAMADLPEPAVDSAGSSPAPATKE